MATPNRSIATGQERARPDDLRAGTCVAGTAIHRSEFGDMRGLQRTDHKLFVTVCHRQLPAADRETNHRIERSCSGVGVAPIEPSGHRSALGGCPLSPDFRTLARPPASDCSCSPPASWGLAVWLSVLVAS